MCTELLILKLIVENNVFFCKGSPFSIVNAEHLSDYFCHGENFKQVIDRRYK